jgi:hypothetical protein
MGAKYGAESFCEIVWHYYCAIRGFPVLGVLVSCRLLAGLGWAGLSWDGDYYYWAAKFNSS